MVFKKIKGTRDYCGYDSQKLKYTFTILEKIAKSFNFSKITTPTIEYTELFSRSVGEETDVVNKEMYTFLDRKARSLSLKPEGTASVVRAVIENHLIDNNQKPSVYYISSMFRYERPQKGRQREFFQFGVEQFGNDSVFKDVEIINLAKKILDDLKINKYILEINSIGGSSSRSQFNKALVNFLKSKKNELSEDANKKINANNNFRIFDTKNKNDLLILKGAPKISDFISEEEKERFIQIKKLLDELKINYIENPNLVRGLDYYNDLVFEFISTDEEKLGAKSTIIGGGRYNLLVNKIDPSKNVPAIGFAIGIERLMLAADDYLKTISFKGPEYYICTINSKYAKEALKISNILRNKDFVVEVNYDDIKLGKKIDLANKAKAEKIIIVGEETKKGNVLIKNLETSKQIEKEIKEL